MQANLSRPEVVPEGEKLPPRPRRAAILRSLLPKRAIEWVGAGLTFAAVGGAAAFGFAASGLANLSAVPPHPEGWAHLLHFSSERAFAAHASAPPSAEPLASKSMIMSGAAQYASVCANCHGAPGYGQSPVALSMRPEPPGLLLAAKTYSEAQLFYVVKNGVRYTAMPAWPVQNRPDEIWSVVAFLKAMPGMDKDTYAQLARGEAARGTSNLQLGGAAPDATAAPNGDKALTPFVPTNHDRPYLPGDPQDPYATSAATAFPRIGFMNLAMGEDPITECVSCHGQDGTGRPDGAFPNLTLQSPQYLYDALHAFAIGQRQSGVMWSVAASLSEEQMRALALRFGTAPAAASRADTGAQVTQKPHGEDLAKGIDPATGKLDARSAVGITPPKLERCTSCHIQEVYLDRVIPRIDGQRAAYLRMQMRAFRDGGRGDTGAYNPMVADSHNLSESDITALAEYYAARAPMPKK